MSNLVAVKAALHTLLDSNMSVPVSYGAPQFASDLTASDGQLTAVWLTDGPQAGLGQKQIPYMVAGAKPTREDVTFEVVAQAISRGAHSTQLAADSNGVAMLGEIESVIAADPTLGLDSPRPLAVQVAGWRHVTLEPAANAKGCRFEITVAYQADIAAPS